MFAKSYVIIVAAVLAVSSCGPTYIDESLITSTSTVPRDIDVSTAPKSFEEALAVIDISLGSLSDALVNGGDEPQVLLNDIELAWAMVEPEIRQSFPDSHFGFYEVMTLARSSVERRRPADSSKAWKLFRDLAAAVTK